MGKRGVKPVDGPDETIPELTAERARKSVFAKDVPELAHLVTKPSHRAPKR